MAGLRGVSAARLAPCLLAALLPARLHARPVQGAAEIRRAVVRIEVRSGGSKPRTGSGVLVAPSGYVLSAAHVVSVDGRSPRRFIKDKDPRAEIWVQRLLDDGTFGERRAAQRVDHAGDHDLVLLKIDGDGLPYLQMGDAEALAEQTRMIAYGVPEGEQAVPQPVDGILSRKGTEWQITNPVSKGYSGGPVLREGCAVLLGIVRGGYEDGSARRVMIPINYAAQLRVLGTVARRLDRETCAPPFASEGIESGPDVEGHNLPPEEEIDALLSGRPQGGVRVAVAPFRVLGKEDTAHQGQSAAGLLTSALWRQDGVYPAEQHQLGVLRDALRSKDPAEPSRAEIQGLGEKLGVGRIVLGQLNYADAEQGRFKASICAWRVADGSRTCLRDIELAERHLERDILARVFPWLMEQLGARKARPQAAHLLEENQLSRAAEAEKRHLEGKLIEAQQIYEEVLPQPSAQVHFEVDYLRLLHELGLHDFARARAERVYELIPVAPETRCDRARVHLQLQGNTVREHREGVRMAARCGSPTLIAEALLRYAQAVQDIHHPLAVAALARAEAQIAQGQPDGGRRDAWLRCYIEAKRYMYLRDAAGDFQGDPEQQLDQLSDRCREGGNAYVAALSARFAARVARHPERRTALFDKAVRLAEPVGGEALDDARLESARDLRAQGRTSAADALLLLAIGQRLREIVRLTGALPLTRVPLDEDLLRRAGVEQPPGLAQPAAYGDKLAVQAHRRALARLLGAWAERTRDESRTLADRYSQMARELEPEGGVEQPLRTEKDLRQRLAAARLPLDQIHGLDQAPLRGTDADLSLAAQALADFCLTQIREGAAAAEREKTLAALRKVVGWLERPRGLRTALYVEAVHLEKEGAYERALASLRRAAHHAKDDPRYEVESLYLQMEIMEKIGPGELPALEERYLAVARRISLEAFVGALRHVAWRRLARDPSSYMTSVGMLVQGAEELFAQRAFAPSANALMHAAELVRAGSHWSGGLLEQDLIRRRVAVVDQLNDPIYSLSARALLLDALGRHLDDRYPGTGAVVLPVTDEAPQLIEEIRKGAERLVSEGRRRDAVRIVASIDPRARGGRELVEQAFRWAEGFKDSQEHPWLLAWLHDRRVTLAESAADKIAALEKSRDLFEAGKQHAQAVLRQARIIGVTEDERGAWRAYRACMKMAGVVPEDRASCAQWIAAHVLDLPGDRGVLRDVAALRQAVRDGLATLRELDPKDARSSLLGSYVSVIAALTRDFRQVESLHAAARVRLAGEAPDAGLWGRHLVFLVRALAQVDARRALRLCQEADESKLVPAEWRAAHYPRCVELARRARDAALEDRFLDRGLAEARQVLERDPADRGDEYRAFFQGDLDAARDAARRHDFAAAERVYAEIARRLAKHAEPDHPVQQALALAQALCRALRRDLAGAAGVLRPQLEAARLDVELIGRAIPVAAPLAAPAPLVVKDACQKSQALEIGASIEMARGRCEAGERLREAAARLRGHCKESAPRAGCHRLPINLVRCERLDQASFIAGNRCGEPFPGDAGLLPNW